MICFSCSPTCAVHTHTSDVDCTYCGVDIDLRLDIAKLIELGVHEANEGYSARRKLVCVTFSSLI